MSEPSVPAGPVNLLVVALLGALLLVPVGLAQSSGGDPNPQAAEWVEADYRFTVSQAFDTVVLDGEVRIHEVDAPPEFAFACRTPCTADDLRSLYRQGSQNDKRQLEQMLEDAVAERALAALQAVAGDEGEAEVTARADRSSLSQAPSGDGFQPPIPVVVSGTSTIGRLAASGYSPPQVAALFDMGGRVEVRMQETIAPGSNLSITLAVAEPLGLIDAQGAVVSQPAEEGASGSWTVTNWQGSEPVQFDETVFIGRTDVAVPERSDAHIRITMDLSDVGIRYGNLVGGGAPASMTVGLEVNGSFAAIESLEEVGSGVVLDHLSADAIRIALDNGLLSKRDLSSYEDQARSSIRSLFAGTFGITAQIHGGLVNSSLAPTSVSTPPGNGPPVRLMITSAAQVPFPPQATANTAQGADGMGAFTITTVPIGQLTLPDVPVPGPHTVTYTFVLPPGVDLVFQDVQGAQVSTGETEDGRRTVTFTSERTGGQGEEATLQGAELVVDHQVAWHLFWPVLLFLFLVLVVLPAVLIAWTIKNRRDQREAESARHERAHPWSRDQEDAGESGGDRGEDGSDDVPGHLQRPED